MTPTAELRGAHPNRERLKIWDLVTQINEVQSRKRCSQIRSLGHYLANEVILSRGPLLPHIPEIVVERRILLLSDRRVRFFSVSDNRISTDRSLSCIENVETKKRAANVRPIMFDADTNIDWWISSSGDKNSKTSNSSTTTKAIPPVLTSTKSKWETRKTRPDRRRPFVSFLLSWGRRVYISIPLRIYDRRDTEASSTCSTYRYEKRSPCLSSRSLNFILLSFDHELCILKWRNWYLTASIIDVIFFFFLNILEFQLIFIRSTELFFAVILDLFSQFMFFFWRWCEGEKSLCII